MSTKFRGVVLALLALSGLWVGIWATGWPRGFYDAFPGLNRVWVGVDGPYNEHLVRDVGGLYLGLGIASLVALWLRDRRSALVLGVAWTVFGIPHLAYHVGHLDPFDTGDKVGNVVALGVALLLGLLLLVASWDGRTNRTEEDG
jgi:hypothetical protein